MWLRATVDKSNLLFSLLSRTMRYLHDEEIEDVSRASQGYGSPSRMMHHRIGGQSAPVPQDNQGEYAQGIAIGWPGAVAAVLIILTCTGMLGAPNKRACLTFLSETRSRNVSFGMSAPLSTRPPTGSSHRAVLTTLLSPRTVLIARTLHCTRHSDGVEIDWHTGYDKEATQRRQLAWRSDCTYHTAVHGGVVRSDVARGGSCFGLALREGFRPAPPTLFPSCSSLTFL